MENRTRLLVGFALLALGLIISVEVWNAIQSFQSGAHQEVFIDYLEIPASERFYYPTHYWIMRIPDYLLRYIVLGVFTTTVGITILASAGWKRLEMYYDTQQVRPVGETNDG